MRAVGARVATNDRMNAVAAIVLAAGGSTRLGRPKQLVQFRGRALIRCAAEAALDSGCSPVVVVLGANASDCAVELHGLPVRLAFNSTWRSGMASSIHTGLNAALSVNAMLDAALLCLCDQPYVRAATLRSIIAARQMHGARIVASEYAGSRGAPALFESSLFAELRALDGEEGARKLLARFAGEVFAVPNATAALDLDTPEDYARLCNDEAEEGAARPRKIASHQHH